jgi:uncharacterized Fe-S cluster-containing radical SAM superfamily protein
MKLLRIYRITHNHFYGGVITAFTGECNIECLFCYSQNQRNTGTYLEAQVIAQRLIKHAAKHGVDKVRISGGDPFPKFDELYKVIEYVMQNSDLNFMIETNGVVLGQDEAISNRLAEFPHDRLRVRVSLKHTDPEKYAILTDSSWENCLLQFKALENLRKYRVNHYVSWMSDFLNNEELRDLFGYLIEYGYMEPWDEAKESYNRWQSRQEGIDPEYFTAYRSIKLKKKEILALLDEVE